MALYANPMCSCLWKSSMMTKEVTPRKTNPPDPQVVQWTTIRAVFVAFRNHSQMETDMTTVAI